MSKAQFDLMRVKVFLSGTLSQDKSKGGFTALLVTNTGETEARRTLTGHGFDTTVTRMQLKAVEASLLAFKMKQEAYVKKHPSDKPTLPIVEFITSNVQVSSGLNKHIHEWTKRDWTTKTGEVLQHADLWKGIYELLSNHVMSFNASLMKRDEETGDLNSAINEAYLTFSNIADTTSYYACVKSAVIDERSISGVVGNLEEVTA